MHVIHARNVMQALPLGVAYLVAHGERAPSRAGEVLVAPGPVTTVYTHPRERVLFSPVRDANPFFHLMEALWVLAGRQDAAFLDNYIHDYSQRFAEDDGSIHDAYGHRLRHMNGSDQLDEVVYRLKAHLSDRQCVLQIWDELRNDLRWVSWKTRPCNTHAYLRVRQEVGVVGASLSDGLVGAHQEQVPYLDITVCCRSNDIIWGAYGANAVQFSMLQEYLAARIGVRVGAYYQVSNNYHAYVSELERLSQRTGRCPPEQLPAYLSDEQYFTFQQNLVDDPATFDQELGQFMHDVDALNAEQGALDIIGHTLDTALNRFLPETAWPAAVAMKLHRLGKTADAIDVARDMEDPAWRTACTTWLMERKK